MKIVFSFLSLCLISISVVYASPGSAEQEYARATSSVFDDASPLLNTKVEVRGLLRWTFENQNLFPPGTSADRVSSNACLPLLIRSDMHDLIRLAKKQDGRIVTISGRIVEVAPPGMVSVTTCKKLGIEVTSID